MHIIITESIYTKIYTLKNVALPFWLSIFLQCRFHRHLNAWRSALLLFSLSLSCSVSRILVTPFSFVDYFSVFSLLLLLLWLLLLFLAGGFLLFTSNSHSTHSLHKIYTKRLRCWFIFHTVVLLLLACRYSSTFNQLIFERQPHQITVVVKQVFDVNGFYEINVNSSNVDRCKIIINLV